MNEFNFNDESEIGTSVSKLKNPIMNPNNNDAELYGLIKNIENRLEDLELSNTNSIQLQPKPLKKPKNNNNISNNNFNYKDIIFIMISFLLLNDKFTIELIYKLPFINNMDRPYPNLIIRTIVFGLLFFLYKKYIK